MTVKELKEVLEDCDENEEVTLQGEGGDPDLVITGCIRHAYYRDMVPDIVTLTLLY